MPKKLRGCLMTLVIVIAGAIAIYYGARWVYYQGWWGKSNPVARYLWLCDAPPEFEQTLYPENMRVLLPACENLGDNITHSSVSVTSDRQYIAVTKASGYAWINLNTGEMTTTRPVSSTLEECVLLVNPKGVLSEDGRRIAKEDGIYDTQSGGKLLNYGLEEPNPDVCQSLNTFYPCAWLPDNRGVLLIPGAKPWGFELLALGGCYSELITHSNYPVPQPVLKFNLPEAYR